MSQILTFFSVSNSQMKIILKMSETILSMLIPKQIRDMGH